ncbi:MAG TPA: glycoside hydrolase family 38 C-terminal domain-containing protein [Armatimonadota bacterium]|nr:glycoside hydrolase family 38 C-terminal domain-containing protein [Armatimonadota bacterium]
MSYKVIVDQELQGIQQSSAKSTKALERFKAELEFAGRLSEIYADAGPWKELLSRASAMVKQAVTKGENIEDAVHTAENQLAPLGKIAKQYTVHCVGHAHIDMNWMWSWPETVATTNDTFATVDRLMDEYPTFHFSQSQTSIYQLMKDYLPRVYDRVKERVREGRWEITANHWVEGDKNLAAGEMLCRHLLYTKRFLKQEFGLPYDAITIDWEPDTFGHAHTIPTILAGAGVKRYYFCRTGTGPRLFWWQGKDGSRILAFDDDKQWYNGVITPEVAKYVFEFEQETGLKDYLYVYGVGDHGGGPTRRDLNKALEMDAWPIFPRVCLSTTDAFFSIAEEQAKDLPVVDSEMNFIFEGCYTSQSNIKYANRKSENALFEAEIAAVLGKGIAGLSYPADRLHAAWKHAMFNQFHDILPGSGVHATYEYSQGLFQEIMTQTTMVKTESLRAIAGMVNTAELCDCDSKACGADDDMAFGGGQGDMSGDGLVTRYGPGISSCCDAFVVFNPNPWERSEVVTVRLWDRTYAENEIMVRDDAGAIFPAQFSTRGTYWGHNFTEVSFPAHHVPGLGYRSYSVMRSVEPGTATGCSGDKHGRLENEFFTVEIEQGSGAIVHLIDKRTGIDFVPAGERLGMLEYMLEAPHGMTAWVIGQIIKTVPFTEGATLEFSQNGPFRSAVKVHHKYHDSTFTLTISLAAGVPRVDFSLDVNWLERGAPEIGVPMLKVAFPCALRDCTATYECPNGSVTRSTNPREVKSHWESAPYTGEVPAQKWADVSGIGTQNGQAAGVTVLNDSKYGHSTDGHTMRITLLRSSYDPDQLPEMGKHTIHFAVQPHADAFSASNATRAGYAFNLPFNVVGTGAHAGALSTSSGFAEIQTPNIMLSGIKKAEDSDALIVRVYEMEGKETVARIKLDATLLKSTTVVETDVLEQPVATNTAQIIDGVLQVNVPAFGLATVKIG